MKKYLFLIIFLLALQNIFSQELDSTAKNDRSIPVITLSESEIEDNGQIDDISGLLQSSEDVYTNNAGYNFGQARYRIRGYDNQNTYVLVNGIKVNDAENGRPVYSNWGGLNDAMRNKVVTSGLSISDYSFGGLGGVTNITTRASEFRKGGSISYSLANKSYRNRAMATYSTGMMNNGWAFTVSASARWSQKGYVEGSFYEALAYFGTVEKKINNNHSLGLTIFGSPSRSGRTGVTTLEAYELTGDHYYNPNWGYQNGKVRNSKIGTYHQPRILFNHFWKIDNVTKLNTSASYVFGRGGTTALNWYDAADPRPDYYRYFPSYYNEDDYMHTYLTDKWQNDESFRQLDWDSFYFANQKNLYTVENESGIDGNSVTGNRAKYIVEERRNDLRRLDISSVFSRELTENIKLMAGINYMSHKTNNFKIISDLLGADWWLDIDQFAERDFSDNFMSQNDINTPNRTVKEGDKFGYDYVANLNNADLFMQGEAKLSKFDLFAAIDLAYTEFWRKGNMINGKFPETSGGNSPKQRFFDYAVKAGAIYKITGRHLVSLNGIYMTRAPYFRNSYVSPRTRNTLISDITGKDLMSEKIFSGDLSYLYRAPFLQVKITCFWTEFRDGIQSNSFYHDELKTLVNYIMTDVNKKHYGLELGVEAKLGPSFVLTAAAGYGQYIYSSRPNVTIAQDNSAEILVTDRTVYIKNYHIGGMPELASTIGLKYNAPKYWFIGVNANYFDYNYITLNPERRTEDMLLDFFETDPQVSEILDQEKLEHGFTVDIFGGASFRVKSKYTLGFSLSVNNILNNKNFITNGFEQYRFDRTNIDKFPSKYYYMYGTTYFLNMYFRF
ncbi:TonB-dependent receptor [Bacteroidales bacterium OttesenSCG-928-I21]|nr:TonB-dependent receptor [Bacteroidales bacterium OttesenSCG-928-I21]